MKPELDFFENFLPSDESSDFFKQLSSEIRWEQKEIRIFGKKILEPRLTAWHGDPEAVYTYSGAKMNPLAWTPALLKIKKSAEKAAQTSFNSVLLNFYRDQNDGMGLHSDDEKELGPEPVIASVSFGTMRKFIFKPRKSSFGKSQTYLLSSGSLLVMRGQTQKFWKHAIPKESSLVARESTSLFAKSY